MATDIIARGMAANASGGSGGTRDYTQLTNKPQINGIEISGSKTGKDLGLTSIPTVVITPEMVIDTNPVQIQCDEEINTIMTDVNISFVILDASAINLGSIVFNKAKMRNEHYWLCIQTAGNFNIDTQQIAEKTTQSVIYNDSTMIGVYEETELQDKEDNSLTTTDKSIVGAINEVNSFAKGLEPVLYDIGSYQASYSDYVIPAILKTDAEAIYNIAVTKKPIKLKWTFLGSETYLNIVSADKVSNTYSFDVCLHNKYHIAYDWDNETEGYVNFQVSDEQEDLKAITGFDDSKTQILKNINGTLTWVEE